MAQMSLMGIYVHSHIHVTLYMYTVMSIGSQQHRPVSHSEVQNQYAMDVLQYYSFLYITSE